VDSAEVAGVAEVGAEAATEFEGDAVGVARERLGAVVGELGDGVPGGVPVARAVLVEVGGGAGKSSEGFAEDGGRLAGEDASELDPSVFEAAVGGGGGGAEVDGPGDPSGGGGLAEVGDLAIEPEGERVGAVDVLLDDGDPVVGEVADQLELDAGVVDGDVGREDQRGPVPLLPEAVDDRGHEAEDAACAPELDQGGPVGVEAVEDLGLAVAGGPKTTLTATVPIRFLFGPPLQSGQNLLETPSNTSR
jgi:hypothetical protein